MNRPMLVVLATTGLLLAACGDDEPEAAGTTTTTTSTSTTVFDDAVGEPDADAIADGVVETADGRNRSYRLHVPDSLGDEPVALLVALHGGGGSAEQFAGENGLEELAEEEGFVVVHPEGISERIERLHTWNAGNCCGTAAEEGVDDVAYIRAVVDEVTLALPIDPNQIFAIGHSNGGMMAYRLACEAAEVFTAVGLQAGAIGVEVCEPVAPVSIIHVHGTADTAVPLSGGEGSGVAGVSFQPTSAYLGTITRTQGCVDEPVEAVDAGNPDLSTTTWSCLSGATVRLALVEGGAHGWFGGSRASRRDGEASVDSSRLIWTFLAQHPR